MWKLQRTSCKFNNTWLFLCLRKEEWNSAQLFRVCMQVHVSAYGYVSREAHPWKCSYYKSIIFWSDLERTHITMFREHGGTRLPRSHWISFHYWVCHEIKEPSVLVSLHFHISHILSKSSVWLPDVSKFLCLKAHLSVTLWPPFLHVPSCVSVSFPQTLKLCEISCWFVFLRVSHSVHGSDGGARLCSKRWGSALYLQGDFCILIQTMNIPELGDADARSAFRHSAASSSKVRDSIQFLIWEAPFRTFVQNE